MKPYYKSVFISDVHLGTRSCKIKQLKSFFDSIKFDKLYIVGDLIDLWALKRKWYFPQEHSNMISKLIGFAKKEKEVIYIPGNHDDFLRDLIDEIPNLNLGDIKIVDDYVYETHSKKYYYLIHGDKFDFITVNQKWLSMLGGYLYDKLVSLNNVFNWGRRKFGLGYWSLSKFIKLRVKQAIMYFNDFETILTNHAKELGYDGVICGHIHHPTNKIVNDIHYCNTGDWVENMTALVDDGKTFKVIKWENGKIIDYSDSD